MISPTLVENQVCKFGVAFETDDIWRYLCDIKFQLAAIQALAFGIASVQGLHQPWDGCAVQNGVDIHAGFAEQFGSDQLDIVFDYRHWFAASRAAASRAQISQNGAPDSAACF